MEELKIVYLPLDKLTPYENNARKHEKADLKTIENSINQFGMCDPIGIWSDKNIIVEGHGRLLALKELGYTEAPCIRLDHLTDEQRKAYAIAHNKTAEMSEWDFEKLESELNELKDLDFDMEQFGFDLSEFEEPAEIVEDEVPEVDEESDPITKRGDIWKLGDHYLMCGDSTEKADVERLMNGNQVDLLVTDPPYNVAYEGKTADALTIENDNMSNDDFRKFLVEAFAAADNVMKNGAAFYIWHADSEGYNFRGACFDNGWKVRQCLIWNKNSMVMGRQDYQWKHEPCLYGWKDGAAHKWYSDRCQTTVMEFNKPNRNGEHPTMKPVELFAYQIGNSTKKGDIVLDTFGGSGTTLIACEQLNRISYTMELDPKYCDVIIKRFENLTGKTAEKIN